MTTVTTKLLSGAAAFALVTTGLVVPIVAQADDTEAGASVGSSAGNTPKRANRGAAARGGGNATNNSAPNNSAPAVSAPAPAPAPAPEPARDSVSVEPAPAAAGAPAPAPAPAPTNGRANRGAAARANASAFANPLFQNQLLWIGTPNAQGINPDTVLIETEPLADLPEWTRQQYGWLSDFQFEACVLGLSAVTQGQNVAGPYGTSITGFSSGGCE